MFAFLEPLSRLFYSVIASRLLKILRSLRRRSDQRHDANREHQKTSPTIWNRRFFLVRLLTVVDFLGFGCKLGFRYVKIFRCNYFPAKGGVTAGCVAFPASRKPMTTHLGAVITRQGRSK